MSNEAKSARDNDGRILTWQEIQTSKDLAEDTVYVEKWGGSVRIRELTQGQYAQIQAEVKKRDPENDHYGLWSEQVTVRFGMIDPELPDEAIEALAEKSGTAITQVFNAIDALGSPSRLSAREQVLAQIRALPQEDKLTPEEIAAAIEGRDLEDREKRFRDGVEPGREVQPGAGHGGSGDAGGGDAGHDQAPPPGGDAQG